MQFKILNRIFYTPSQLHKMGIRDDSKYINCTAKDCKENKELWFGITKQIVIFNNIDIPLTPQSCILGE